MIRDTSIAVYHQIVAEGLLSKRRLQVYDCLYKHGPMTQNETYVELNVPNLQQSSIMPRFAELKDMGVIRETGKRICTVTGRTVLEWDVTSKLPVKKDKELTFSQKKEKILKDVVSLGERLQFYPDQREKLLEIYWQLKKL